MTSARLFHFVVEERYGRPEHPVAGWLTDHALVKRALDAACRGDDDGPGR